MGMACSTREELRNEVLVGKPEEMRILGNVGVGRLILRWILEKWDGVVWIGLILLNIGDQWRALLITLPSFMEEVS
jgi:hypothetical protein